MFDNLIFNNPEFFWFLILLPIIILWNHRNKKSKLSYLKFSSVKGFSHKSIKMRLFPFLDYTRYFSIIMLVIIKRQFFILRKNIQIKYLKLI